MCTSVASANAQMNQLASANRHWFWNCKCHSHVFIYIRSPGDSLLNHVFLWKWHILLRSHNACKNWGCWKTLQWLKTECVFGAAKCIPNAFAHFLRHNPHSFHWRSKWTIGCRKMRNQIKWMGQNSIPFQRSKHWLKSPNCSHFLPSCICRMTEAAISIEEEFGEKSKSVFQLCNKQKCRKHNGVLWWGHLCLIFCCSCKQMHRKEVINPQNCMWF